MAFYIISLQPGLYSYLILVWFRDKYDVFMAGVHYFLLFKRAFTVAGVQTAQDNFTCPCWTQKENDDVQYDLNKMYAGFWAAREENIQDWSAPWNCGKVSSRNV
jgi:hypothetical protein